MIVDVSDQSQVSAARRVASDMARAQNFDDDRTGRIALIVTEMATNLLKHAERGNIVINRYGTQGNGGLEMLALDKGRGIPDLARSLEDGYSTAGSAGHGLGTIRRQADAFDIFSRPGAGTVLMARVDDAPSASDKITLGAVVDPYPGEEISGDAWSFANPPAGPTLFAVDGSGHGPLAATAAQTAVKTFQENATRSNLQIGDMVHRAMMPTRGGAIGVARVDPSAKLVRFVGVGNLVAAFHAGNETRRMVSHNGTAGYGAPRIREFTFPYAGPTVVIIHSDGLSAKWDLATYPGLQTSHPSVIAGVLFRDFRRGRDDASVVVMRVMP